MPAKASLSDMHSLHLIGSALMGGAERWFVRFLQAMAAEGEAVHAGVRQGSELARLHLQGIRFDEIGFRTVWDPLSRWECTRLIERVNAPIVQTYMGRATRLTHIAPGSGRVHVARLGGYYKLRSFAHAQAWIGNTRQLCDWMVKGGLPTSRVHHITNFVEPAPPADPLESDRLRALLGFATSDVILVAGGRLVDFKGHRYLIDAFRRLPTHLQGRRIRLLMLGDGDLRADLQAQCREAGVQDRVQWAGWQHDPTPWLHLADVIVFPSRACEPMGNVILEAWAHGKPLVTTASRGATELTCHGENAWVVPCDDPATLAEGIDTVLREPALRQQLAEQGARQLARHHSSAAVITAYRDLYARLLGLA